MSFPSKLIIYMCLITASFGDEAESPQVKTPLGDVKGFWKKSYDGRSYAAFEGIPFAKPPVGDLRFEEPQAINPWIGTWDATKPHTCVQVSFPVTTTILGDEDCLYINVYVPEEKLHSQSKLDVIVHIHGGAFMAGSGHSYCLPGYLMDRDIVYVTFNYRVGIFGFLSTGDKIVPGNNGLKDQTLALKWIQDNIESFGGNPNSVTLTGLSAGGASVHYHYLSSLSKGLFHRGIAQSGVAISCWTLQKEPVEKAKRLAVLSGCPDDDSKTMVNCLKRRTVQQIYSNLKEFHGPLNSPLAPFAPVVEKPSPNAFISEHPYLMLIQQKVLDVPLILSVARDEGILVAAGLENQLDDLNKNWREWAPILLDFNYTVPKSNWVATAIKIKDYFIGQGEEFKEDNMDKLVKLFGERLFTSDFESVAKLQSKANKAPIYAYQLSYENDRSLSKFVFPDSKYKGVCHGDDAQFLFMVPFASNNLPQQDLKMKDLFVNMVVTYAKSGVPQFEGFDWQSTNSDALTYLNILSPNDMRMVTTDKFTARSFWKSLGILENENIINIKDEL